MDIIEDIAIIQEVKAGKVLVQLPGSDSCDTCAVKGFCHQNDSKKCHWIDTDLSFEVGDKVRVFISPALRIISSFVVFMFPIIMMLIFYLMIKYLLSASENLAILGSILSLGVSVLLIFLLDKKLGKEIKFEIMEKVYEDEIEAEFSDEN